MKPEINDSKWIDGDGAEARAHSLATINAIADTVYRYLDFQTLVERTVDVILEYIPVSSVALFSLDPSREWLDLAAWRGFTAETLEVGSRLPVGGSLTGLTVLQRDIVTTYDLAHNDQLEPRVKQALLAQGLTGCISVPLLIQEQTIGAANLIFQETHRLTPLERETLLAIGKTIGLAMINAQHMNRIEAEVRERRRVEAELWRYQEHLEELVAARTADLEDANAQLVELIAERQANEQKLQMISQAKTVFLSNMSHEIRTPLNVIIGFASSMLNDSLIYDGETLPDIFRKDIRLMQDNAGYILRMINDLLDLSKIEAGRFDLRRTEVDLVRLLNEVTVESQGLVKDKPIRIETQCAAALPLVWADAVRVRQIMLNLMSNAIKFTKAGRVSLQAQVSDGAVHISVTDTGVGIPASALPHLFDRFQQANADPKQRGTGLGLNISKQLVQLHGSDLTVTTEVGKGSTFAFTLPFAENQSATPQPVTSRGAVTLFDDDGAE